MDEAWILQASEIRRPFSRATCFPLRASINDETGKVTEVGQVGDIFAWLDDMASLRLYEASESVAELRLSPWFDRALVHLVTTWTTLYTVWAAVGP